MMVWILLLALLIAVLCAALSYLYALYQHCSTRKCPEISCPKPLSLDRVIDPPRQMSPERDRRVISDPLYPPLNRYKTGEEDRYRLVGYMVGSEDLSDSWRLFARDTGRGRASFYAMPSDKNREIKVSLDNPKLRDLYDIPKTISLSSPLFKSGNYEIIELEKHDFSSNIYV